MNETIKRDILAILRQSVAAIGKRDILILKELSNHTIHNASIFQDPDSVTVATIIYALSKILDRRGHLGSSVIDAINRSIEALEHDRIDEFQNILHELLREISQIDSKIKLYIDQVISQAQIKKGSKIFEHGISVGRAAEILGISPWELMDYIGKTHIADQLMPTDETKRLEAARRIFNIRN